MFRLFDLDHDSFLNAAEFINGTFRLFSSCFEDNVRLIFEIFDFDADGLISKEDIRTLLSHVPLSEVLADLKLKIRKEGQYTRSGGGLYLHLHLL